MNYSYAELSTPVGGISFAWSDDGDLVHLMMDRALSRSTWETDWAPGTPTEHLERALRVDNPDASLRAGEIRSEPVRALKAYFRGEITEIDALPVAPVGTEFQRAIWDALRDIPAGETRTYGELAHALGKPAAARAVGGAVGSNPIALVIPCHRVVGSTGALTGFGGGMARKHWLLRHEGIDVPAPSAQLALAGLA